MWCFIQVLSFCLLSHRVSFQCLEDEIQQRVMKIVNLSAEIASNRCIAVVRF